MKARPAKPRKDLPAWTQQTPDKVTVNPPAVTKKNFKSTTPGPVNNFTKTTKSTGKSSMPLSSGSTVLNFNIKKRKIVK